MPIDFSALNSPNFFADYAGGLKAGQEMKQANAQRKAYNMFSSDPAAAEAALIAAGDFKGANAMQERRETMRQETARTTAGGQIKAGDMRGAQSTYMDAGMVEMANAINTMDKSQREAIKEQNKVLAAALYPLRDLPPDQAAAQWAQRKQVFIDKGYKPEDVEIDFTKPGVVAAHIAEAMEVDKLIDQANKDRTFEESRRHNQVGEKNDAARVGISRGQLGVAQSNSARGWAAHNARVKAGGYGTPGVGGVIPDDDVEIDP